MDLLEESRCTHYYCTILSTTRYFAAHNPPMPMQRRRHHTPVDMMLLPTTTPALLPRSMAICTACDPIGATTVNVLYRFRQVPGVGSQRCLMCQVEGNGAWEIGCDQWPREGSCVSQRSLRRHSYLDTADCVTAKWVDVGLSPVIACSC